MRRVFEIYCFIVIILTRINYILSVNTSIYFDQKTEWIKPTQNKNQSVDEYMQGFYETNENGADENVRQFFPVKEKQKWLRKELPLVTEMLFFNTSAVEDNEEVTLAQLHLHRRRLLKTHDSFHKRFLPSPYRVVLYQVQPNYRYKKHEDARTMKLASLPVSHRTRGGWHTLDVTPIMRELLINAQGPVELLLGVHFEAPKKQGDFDATSPVSIKHFLKNPNFFTPQHPYKTPCYLVVYSEKDPFFEYFEEDGEYTEEEVKDDEKKYHTVANNFIPTLPPKDRLRERHLKHKIIKGKNEETSRLADQAAWKHKPVENEIIKSKRKYEDRVKNKGTEFRRSKADELALKEKTKLKSLPFLHANEVEDIRQTSRRLTRPSLMHKKPENKSKYSTKPDLITSTKVER